jgi:hypothetical protein
MKLSLRAALLVAAMAAGCGPGSGGGDTRPADAPGNALGAPDATTAAAPDVPGGVEAFLYTGAGFVDYLQWQDAQEPVSGTLNDNRLTGTPPTQKVQSSTSDFTMTIRGSTVAININGTQSYGALHGDNLSINFSQADGTIAGSTWTRATPSDYNAALQALQSVAVVNDRLQVTNDNIASLEQALGDAADRLRSATVEVRKSPSSVPSDLSSLDADTRTAATDADAVVKERNSGADQGTVCSDAAGVASDAAGVASDAAGIASDAAWVTNAVAAARAQSRDLDNALKAVSAAEPAYVGTARTPSPADVAALSQSAASAVAGALGVMNRAIDHANAQVVAADGSSRRAYAGGGCGDAPTSPTPVAHIS